jgi:hypothetical protein
MDNMLSPIARITFIVAFVAAGLGILERLLNMLGYTILRGTLTGGRLFEISAILVIFVIAMLLREIRNILRSRSG